MSSVPRPQGWISHDDKPLPTLCDCRFTDDGDDPPGECWHYDRKCRACGATWRGLHCPHDGTQNRCPGCGKRPVTVSDTGTEAIDSTVNGYPSP